MKLIKFLEKPQVISLSLLSILFFILRFPSLFEPYWYGDEGIYFVIGDALRHGRILYEGVWDNKPPLLYVFYQFFGQNIFSIKFVSVIFGIGIVIAFYKLYEIVFKSNRHAVLASLVLTFLLGTPLLEGNIANAENFILLPILIGFLLFFNAYLLDAQEIKNKLSPRNMRILAASGISFGVAFLFKIVGIFDLLALIFFLFLSTEISKNNFSVNSITLFIKREIKYLFPLILGFLLPTIIYGIVAIIQGNFLAYIQGAFLNNVSYVRAENDFIIPHGFLVLKTLVLGVFLCLFYRLRKKIPLSLLFIGSWLIFSLYSIYFSQRPYGHYVLLLVPSFILFTFSAFHFQKIRKQILIICISILVLILSTFEFFMAPRIISYYGNFFSFLSGQKSTSKYISSFDYRTERDYTLASFIKKLPNKKDNVFIWGDSAQIYFMSNTLPIGKYIVSYHVTTKPAINDVEKAVVKAKPKYIIVLPYTSLLPFSLAQYNYWITIEGATIYERTN